jgi:hypothetical protein
MTPAELATALQSNDDKARTAGIEAAPQVGAPAIKTVSPLLASPDTETRRAANRALFKIVRDAGKPGAAAQARAVEAALVDALQLSTSVPERRDVLWMISEIGGDSSVKPVAALLVNLELREDARCVLQRIPGKASLQALKDALRTVPEDFRDNIAESLRKRGEKVSGHPSQRLVPSKPTSVTMVQ